MPDVGIITNIGVAHIEFMGSREAIAEEKGALAEAVGARGHSHFECGRSVYKEHRCTHARQSPFSRHDCRNDPRQRNQPERSGTDFTILEGAHRCRAQLPVPGLHMVQNALLAVAAGRVFGLSLEDCAAGLVAAPLTKGAFANQRNPRRAVSRRQLQRKSRFHESGLATR